MIGLVVGRRPGGAQTDIPGGGGQGAEDRHGIQSRRVLIAATDADFLIRAKPIRDREAVGEKDQVEFPALEDARNIDIVL